MRELTDGEVAALSPDELMRIQATLRKRIRRVGDSNILAVGFGAKVARRALDKISRRAVRYLVRKKREPRRKACRIRPTVTVRLKRYDPNHFVIVTFPTDVEQIPSAGLVGLCVRTDSGSCTTGIVIRWLPPGIQAAPRASWNWGILTVAHAFYGRNVPSPVEIVRTDQPGSIPGELIAFSGRNSSVDAAIVRVSRNDLKAIGLAARQQVTCVSVDDLQRHADKRSTGESLRISDEAFESPAVFEARTFFPGRNDLPGLEKLEGILHVHAHERRAFTVGTSGSAWTVRPESAILRLACIQVAAELTEFQHGFGQAVAVLLPWARDALQTQDLRIVRAF